MSPRRNIKRSSRPRKQAQRLAQEMLPYAVVDRPPRDPPSINANPKRRMAVDLFFGAVGNAVNTSVTLLTLRDQIAGQTGMVSGAQNILLHKIHLWVQGSTPSSTSAATSTSASLRLVEPYYNVESRDDSSPFENSVAGIRYPLNIARTYTSVNPANTVLFNFTVSSGTGITTGVTARIYVTLWGTSTT